MTGEADGSTGGAADAVEDAERYDVAVVGGGPAGSSAAVFTARAGLEVVVFDRGNSSLARCGHLENFLGFPVGIDVETFYGLMHDHVEEAGAELIPDLVERVERVADAGTADAETVDGEPADAETVDGEPADAGTADGFLIGTQDGRTAVADAVVAATTYDAEYLRPLDDEGAMFEAHEHGGETHERFDGGYADADGRTPIEGLYVAGPMADGTNQAIAAAGDGASVACELLRDRRETDGLWDPVSGHWDWVRRASDVDDEAALRDHLRDWAAREAPADLGPGDDRFERVCERLLEERSAAYVDREELDVRAEAGKRRLAEHLPDDLLLDVVDDERVREYAASLPADVGE
ncbi:NAD(P)/FAD-dependent oxidoreductase (plasmid) [Halorarum halophilum]|uniref:NAD(P)/FAD-dependent oxidoreductase n=1 Tax=Halorarum halophilum TaxID=2743090 RepID=A0A7D5KPR1_9EURY|nr:FAD-dependent oxidoreductase [Halobaculum halophilum]QLG29762.1 NAD(P)/FAD-dependent oxidoreductase [Halobaculum halophilum]